MMTSRLMGVYAVIPAALLLTVSFFILLANRKVESYALKVFGYVVAAALWLSALLVISSGVYTMYTGRGGMNCPMFQKMQGKQMMGGQMPGMTGKGTSGSMMHKDMSEPMMR
ncbi:MAG: hypothetical protein PHG40_05155 [Candidatus Omnitrophica bacterium]|nr:hypothetical protein [Candidatus Omnitrophota bacterium]